ncbi:hypothetical protein [Roseovarius sp. 217]|uniref:hypothetical protein n=1 Tax=Roseovarius sp. (strain 217) TaxID=314264 RepID=UPI0012EE6422|nr:hypothetical protein [Roseovarius sp. 217]
MTRFFLRRRVLVPLFLMLALVGLVSRCVPEKSIGMEEKATPLIWLDEHTYFYSQNNDVRALSIEDRSIRPTDKKMPIWAHQAPQFDTEPIEPGQFFVQDNNTYSVIDGSKMRVIPYQHWKRSGINQSFPRMEGISFNTYLHLGKVGLIVFEAGKPKLINLPLKLPDNRSAPFVVWDKHAGMFFAIQNGCEYPNEDGSCQRTAWWLDRDLNLVQVVALPEEDLLFVEEKFSCFSCGCGCVTREDIYAVNGKVFFQVSGSPIPSSRRGLYELVQEADESTSWRQVIEGRVEPPMAFSPSGCHVAFYRVSYLGNALEEKNVCSTGN